MKYTWGVPYLVFRSTAVNNDKLVHQSFSVVTFVHGRVTRVIDNIKLAGNIIAFLPFGNYHTFENELCNQHNYKHT